MREVYLPENRHDGCFSGGDLVVISRWSIAYNIGERFEPSVTIFRIFITNSEM